MRKGLNINNYLNLYYLIRKVLDIIQRQEQSNDLHEQFHAQVSFHGNNIYLFVNTYMIHNNPSVCTLSIYLSTRDEASTSKNA